MKRRALYLVPAGIALAISAAAVVQAAPDPQPLPKVGGCPSGYSSDSSYCVPGWSARYAILRQGACPSDYGSDGNYCVASSPKTKTAIPRNGSCPSGYSSDGNYCVAGR